MALFYPHYSNDRFHRFDSSRAPAKRPKFTPSAWRIGRLLSGANLGNDPWFPGLFQDLQMKNTRQAVLKSLFISLFMSPFSTCFLQVYSKCLVGFFWLLLNASLWHLSPMIWISCLLMVVRFTQPRYAPTPHFAQHHFTGWWLSPTPLKIWKSVGSIIPDIWKNKKCSKPPSSSSLPWSLSFSLLESIAFRPGFFLSLRVETEVWDLSLYPHSFWLNHNQVIDRVG